MNSLNKAIAVATLTAAAPLAQAAVEISGNVAMTTDYTFRGVSQTQEKPAIQGGFDAAWDNGFYVGTWASNVDFGPANGDGSAQAEMDFYLGYGFEVSEGISLDFSYIYFVYPGEESGFNYQEFVAALGISDFTFSLVYSDEYFGDGGPDAYVFNADYSLGVSEEVSVDFHIGFSDADADDFFGEDDSYIDYSVGVNYDIAGVTLSLAWVGTDLDDNELADDRAVFTISKSL